MEFIIVVQKSVEQREHLLCELLIWDTHLGGELTATCESNGKKKNNLTLNIYLKITQKYKVALKLQITVVAGLRTKAWFLQWDILISFFISS